MAVPTRGAATRQIAEANAGVRLRLPFADTEDSDDARRGWIASSRGRDPGGVIRS